jgi:hypothetical protein
VVRGVTSSTFIGVLQTVQSVTKRGLKRKDAEETLGAVVWMHAPNKKPAIQAGYSRLVFFNGDAG